MSKLVLYYSFSGKSAKRAEESAKSSGAELVAVKPAKKIGKLKAYTAGIIKAIRGRPMPVETLTLPEYSAVDVFAPVWADCIAPPMLAALQQLKKGTKVSLRLVSASGKSNTVRNKMLLTMMGLDVMDYEDLK
jgi:hypothetical protein